MNETAHAPAGNRADTHRAALRASDADRDRAADILGAALAEGRISQEEHSDRTDAAYAARTLGELAPLTADLPDAAAGAGPAPAGPHGDTGGMVRAPNGTENIRSVLAAAVRKGRWLVEPRTNVATVLGATELDMRSAVLSQHEVTVRVTLLLGALKLVVPPGVNVVSRVAGVAASTANTTGGGAAPGGPTVVVTGKSWLSAVEIQTAESRELNTPSEPGKLNAAERGRSH
ncbi:DUF1707 domain-containing protein [Streptomonospora sediminis]